jgi:hypothetical protein
MTSLAPSTSSHGEIPQGGKRQGHRACVSVTRHNTAVAGAFGGEPRESAGPLTLPSFRRGENSGSLPRMSIRRWSRVALVAALACGQPARALAQRVPSVCTGTRPANVANVGDVQGLSVVSSPNDTLWILYDSAVGGRRTVSLMSLSGVRGTQIATNTFAVGEGAVGRASLALVGSTLVGAYRRADGRVRVFTRPVAGGFMSERAMDAGLVASAVPTVASVGRNALVAWSLTDSGAAQQWVGVNGAPQGPARRVTASHSLLDAVGAFGGMTFAVSSPSAGARVDVLTARGPVPVNAAHAGGVRALSAAETQGHAMVLTAAGGQARVSFLRAASGTGTEHVLGPAVDGTHVAIASTAWGAFALWSSAGTLSLRVVRANGELLGTAMPMAAMRPTSAEGFSAAAMGDGVYAFWAEGGVVRMLRMQCFG